MPENSRQNITTTQHSRFFSTALTLLLVPLMASQLVLGPAMAEDMDAMLKPLVDTSRSAPATPTPATTPNTGAGHGNGDVPVSWHSNIPANKSGPPLSTQAPLVLNGKIESLQSAIDIERDKVDWYAWYLSVRKYLARTGGLPCMLGTPIRFYRNGRIEALTPDPVCQASVEHRRFPLPAETRLDAILLPVRKGTLPPVTPNELYTKIKE
jgi:hypothetical protein